jgi:hypothetical protein
MKDKCQRVVALPCLISPRQDAPRAMYVESNDLVPQKKLPWAAERERFPKKSGGLTFVVCVA